MSTLLTTVEAFLTAHEMRPTAFGARALGDKHFVRQLRAGRRVWPETEKKVLDFIATYQPTQAAA